MKSAIPKQWVKKICEDIVTTNTDSNTQDLYNRLIKSKSRNRIVYDALIDDPELVVKYKTRWNNDGLDIMCDEYYIKQFVRLYRYTKHTKYRDFQYRLMLNKLVLNVDLKLWGKKESDLCSFCGNHSETTVHLFCECVNTVKLFDVLFDELGKSSELRQINAVNTIFSHIHEKDEHMLNFVCTFIKQYIYKHRCLGKGVTVENMLCELEYYHEIEFHIAEQENCVSKHKSFWGPIVEFEN